MSVERVAYAYAVLERIEDELDHLPVGGVRVPDGAPPVGPLIALAALLRETLNELRTELNAPFHQQCPALERWRAGILEAKRPRPLELAAAWELTAVDCERSGASDLAAQCRAKAAHALGVLTMHRVCAP